jgi:hypothetical protein
MSPQEALQLAIDSTRERIAELEGLGQHGAASTERDMLEGLLAVQDTLARQTEKCLLCRVRVGRPVTVVLDSGDREVVLCDQCVDSMYNVGPLARVVIASRLERAQN